MAVKYNSVVNSKIPKFIAMSGSTRIYGEIPLNSRDMLKEDKAEEKNLCDSKLSHYGISSYVTYLQSEELNKKVSTCIYHISF